MNTTEGNKLIAEFMGFKLYTGGLRDCYVDNNKNPIYLDQLQYHTSWDWLMPVVEKIYGMYEWDKFYYNPVMCHFYLTENIKILTGKTNGETDEGYCGKMKYIYKPCEPKYAIWQAVILFIEWLNSEQSVKESDTTKAT